MKSVPLPHEVSPTTFPSTDHKAATNITQSFLNGLGSSSNLKLTATLRNSDDINIDGLNGRHLLYDVSATGADKKMLADFVVLLQDKRFWAVIVVSNMQSEAARTMRARILNTLRAGQ